ncbi:MAG TPA: ABC transporter ATP-binding protein [Firmicutes bacterium]|nr:ABC transporter ATP-binding protein [Bacillota bacterium]
MYAIEATGLYKRYGEVIAVNGIDLAVKQGEIFGMLGPNGAGKTTTTEMLVGLRQPDAGVVKILSMDPKKEGAAIKARIGVQLQTSALFNHLTVRETLVLMASFFPRCRPVDELLNLVDLQEKANVQTRHLSGGQQQRLQVALAMVNDGDLLFLDEPTTGLDPQARRRLWDIIEKMREEGKTVFLTTHYMEEAEKLCDRVAVIDHGQIIALGSPDELIAAHFGETAIELPAFSGLDDHMLAQLAGVSHIQRQNSQVTLYSTAVPATVGALLELAQKLGVSLENLMIRRATLEDVFLKLTGRRIRE